MFLLRFGVNVGAQWPNDGAVREIFSGIALKSKWRQQQIHESMDEMSNSFL